jgi:hypothetical protein
MPETPQHFGWVRFAWTTAALTGITLATMFIIEHFQGPNAKFDTLYQGVLLTNGSAYFGQLTGYGGPHPLLTHVYYVASQTNPDTKQVSNVLVKRGKELYGPDRMYINPSQIVAVEPVGPHSKVAELIGQASQ